MSDLSTVADNLSQQSQEIQTKLKEAQKVGVDSINDLISLLGQIKNNVDACLAGHKNSLQVGSENIDSLRKKIATAKDSENVKFQEEIRLARKTAQESNKKIADLEAQIQQQAEKKTSTVGPQQLEQIRKLEQQRLAVSAEAQVLRKERDLYAEKLDKFSNTVVRIAALRKKCASQGKSLADEIGENTALQLNDVESKQKQNITEQQKKLEMVETKLKQIEENLSEAYEQECTLRDEQQKLQENLQNQNQIDSTLQTELQDERQKLAQVTQSLSQCEAKQTSIVASLTDTETQLAKLKEQFSELYKIDLSRKENEELLKQQIGELAQENASLTASTKLSLENNQNASDIAKLTLQKSALEQEVQDLKVDNISLRDRLQVSAKQLIGFQTNETMLRTDTQNLLEQIQSLGSQIDKLKEENLAVYKTNELQNAEIERLKEELKNSIAEAAEAAQLGKRLLDQLIKEQQQ